jgi:uncharacterized YigZ family protein
VSFLTIARTMTLEEEIKGSRFIACLARAQSVDEATAFLDGVKQAHPDATHHCWAYRIGEAYRFSDDGEPGGTAGKPMLEVFTRRDLQQVMGVVVRYYGGTKLGAGGLVRAYGGTLAKALDLAGVLEIKPRVSLRVEVPFADMDAVHRFLAHWPELDRGAPAFTARGMTIELSLLETDQARLTDELTDLTRGAARIAKSRGTQGTG